MTVNQMVHSTPIPNNMLMCASDDLLKAEHIVVFNFCFEVDLIGRIFCTYIKIQPAFTLSITHHLDYVDL